MYATLNSACSLPPLANIDWLLFQSTFCQLCNSMIGEMAPMEGSSLAMRRPDMALTVCTCLSRPCSGMLALCGYM